jgi:hypothetical protein
MHMDSRRSRVCSAVLLAGWCAALCGSAAAQEGAAARGKLHWYAGPDLQYLRYEEPGTMEEEGAMLGVRGAASRDEANGLRWTLKGSLSAGTLRYKGSVENLITGEIVPAEVDTPNTVFGAAFDIGKPLSVGAAHFVPYTGAGVRALVDDLPGDSGYTREQTYLYIPLGLELDPVSFGAWSAGCAAEFDYLVRGFNHSSTDQGDIDAQLEQDSGYGVHLAARLGRDMKTRAGQPTRRFSLEAFYEYWDIDSSNTDTDEGFGVIDGQPVFVQVSYVEPANNTTVVGLAALVSF